MIHPDPKFVMSPLACCDTCKILAWTHRYFEDKNNIYSYTGCEMDASYEQCKWFILWSINNNLCDWQAAQLNWTVDSRCKELKTYFPSCLSIYFSDQWRNGYPSYITFYHLSTHLICYEVWKPSRFYWETLNCPDGEHGRDSAKPHNASNSVCRSGVVIKCQFLWKRRRVKMKLKF